MKQSARISIISVILITSMLLGVGAILKKTVIESTRIIDNEVLLQEVIKHIEPVRGNVFDKNGELLAENISSFEVVLIPGFFPEDADEKHEFLELLASTANLDLTWLNSLLKSDLLINNPYQPKVIKRDISSREAIRLGTLLNKYPAFEIRPIIRRRYHVLNSGLAHVIGYMGRLDSIDPTNKTLSNYQRTSLIGLSGIEATQEQYLRGIMGESVSQQDVTGRSYSVRPSKSSQAGIDITLTIDYQLQVQGFKSLQKYIQAGIDDARDLSLREGRGPYKHEGAFVVMDVQTGELLALASTPGYDPNIFSSSDRSVELNAVLSDPHQPLVSRATMSLEPPGSTFKPLVALAALEIGTANPNTRIVSNGELLVPNMYNPDAEPAVFRDWYPHGSLDMTRAIVRSSDIYFYILAGGWPPDTVPAGDDVTGLGPENISTWASYFGFGMSTGVEITTESTGLVPSEAWKNDTLNESWTLGDTYQFGIGQGNLLATPLQLAVYAGALANGGTRLKPTVIKNIDRSPVSEKIPAKNENFSFIRNAMVAAASGPDGTARRAKPSNYKIGAKTGTAEFGPAYSDGTYDEHGLVIAFGPIPNPEIAVVVYIKHGNGAYHASPVAKDIFESYLNSRVE
ncbi:MAG TPA: hypothetical protein EYQ00_09680 [Dehalococcoidia bacterium]|nr:hypothetical protein [Dehalococcoidia bacterium]